MIIRIQTRVVRRCGELLKTYQTGPKGGRPSRNGGDGPPVSQTQAGADAGMSKDQQVTAVRVANVPADEFERQAESERPPTVTQLAKRHSMRVERTMRSAQIVLMCTITHRCSPTDIT